MKEYDIVLLTESRYEKPVTPNWYEQNILDDDKLLQHALEQKGLSVIRKDWATPNFNWGNVRYAVFRTTWDYFDRFDEFNQWLISTGKRTTFINPLSLIQWNIDKTYLSDVHKKGINMPPTQFHDTSNTMGLVEWFNESNWKEAVVKPTIAGAARYTYRISAANIDEVAQIIDPLIKQEKFILQEFQHNIVTEGEVSLIVIGGKFTHAVLKIAKPGDFRGQDDFGGSVHAYEPSQEEISFAEKAVEACPSLPTYARVDIFRDNQNVLARTHTNRNLI